MEQYPGTVDDLWTFKYNIIKRLLNACSLIIHILMCEFVYVFDMGE